MTTDPDVLFTDALHDPTRNRSLRITVDATGESWVTIESSDGPYTCETFHGGEGLLVWLQAQAEAAHFVNTRHQQRSEAA